MSWPLSRWVLSVGTAGLLALLGALMGKEILAIGLATQLVEGGNGPLAHRLRPQNGRASAMTARALLAQGELARAKALAIRGLQSSPFDVVAIRTLGEVNNQLDPGSGDSLMLVAGQLGWRDRPTQLWLIEQAVWTGDARVAVERAEALVRLQTDRELVYSLMRLLAADPRSRAILVHTLVGRPFWRTDFLGRQVPTQQLALTARLLEDLSNTPVPPTLIEAKAAIDGLANSGRYAEAFALYVRLLRPSTSRRSLLADGGFEGVSAGYASGAQGTVFDWRFRSGSGAEATVEMQPDGNGNHALYAYSPGSTYFRSVGRTMVLGSGSYLLRYRVRSASSDAPSVFHWAITCIPHRRILHEFSQESLVGAGWEIRSERFMVPTTGCPAQMLELQSRPSSDSRPREALYDDFALGAI